MKPRFVVAAVVMAACGLAAAQSFTLLGYPVGGTSSRGFALSDDGAVAAGYGVVGTASPGFMWTAVGGRFDYGQLPGLPPRTPTFGISGNGSTAVGASSINPSAQPRAFRWSATGGYEELGISAGYTSSYALDADYAGGVVVGRSQAGQTGEFGQAFRWTSTTGLVGLGYTRPEHFYSEATAVSADGSVVIGHSRAIGSSEAFVWTTGTGMQALPMLPGETSSGAGGMNSSGSIIVGFSGPGSPVATMWRNGLPESLGLVPGMSFSNLLAVNDAGTVAVGVASGPGASQAAVWTPEYGMERLVDYLGRLGVSVPPGVYPSICTSISRDGTVITGYTGQPGTVREAFVAVIPAPWTPCVVYGGLAALGRRRRE